MKAYPNPSHLYAETVCCAGVDLDTGRWVRMYPITFRRLAGKQFAKFQEIACLAKSPRDDTRPESLRVAQESIERVGEPMPAGPAGWTRRMARLPQPAQSLEEILAARKEKGSSLGMFRPREVLGLTKEKADPWTDKQKEFLRQQTLPLGEAVARELNELEQIPWKFRYRFTCDDTACNKEHRLLIIDWEIGAAYRRWVQEYGDGWEAKLREMFEQDLPARDLHLVVGNAQAHPDAFMVVGLVRPPRPKVGGGNVQQRLDLVGQQGTVTRGRVSLKAEQADALRDDDGQEGLDLLADES